MRKNRNSKKSISEMTRKERRLERAVLTLLSTGFLLAEPLGASQITPDTTHGADYTTSVTQNGGVYTVANPDACVPIKELARLCSETLSGGRARVVFDIPESALTYGYAPDVKMRLNADKMKALGWQPSIPLDEMLRRLAADIRSFSETN